MRFLCCLVGDVPDLIENTRGGRKRCKEHGQTAWLSGGRGFWRLSMLGVMHTLRDA